MYSKVYSGAIIGTDGFIISVEADVSNGLPQISMVGFLGSEVKEAKERVRIAIRNLGISFPPKRITINLCPADIRKEGTAFDLPIAVAILSSFGYIQEKITKNILFIGELGLNGTIHKIKGVLPIVFEAKKRGISICIVPKENAMEGALIEGISVIGVSFLQEVIDYLNGKISIENTKVSIEELLSSKKHKTVVDFSEVEGQEIAKRALEISVSGMHNILLIGPPGSGKTMLANRVPTILPKLDVKECLEISKIYSVTGLFNRNNFFVLERPFRSPHHTITTRALIGGGRLASPGEISLAQGGVLFLDELPEFKREVLEVLRQPLEDRKIMISRLQAIYCFPADFLLIAAMNPCNCGNYPDKNLCHCSNLQIKRYLGKISEPFLDRIDIYVETNRIEYSEIKGNKKVENSSEIQKRVMEARKVQKERYKEENFELNGQLSPDKIKQYCKIGKKEDTFLKEVFQKMKLSVRAYHKILKVARTIADLDCSKEIKTIHLSEAICYRSIDKKYWGD